LASFAAPHFTCKKHTPGPVPGSHQGQRPQAEPRFSRSELAGGKTGEDGSRHTNATQRGDFVVWLTGKETGAAHCSALPSLLDATDALVRELLELVTELNGRYLYQTSAMCTCYPGGGTRYIKHCDNHNSNGRKLTVILYLNFEWQSEHGGQLRIHPPLPPATGTSAERRPMPGQIPGPVDIAPIGGRLLVSSRQRVPHEVLPTHAMRFAATVWYFDMAERMGVAIDSVENDGGVVDAGTARGSEAGRDRPESDGAEVPRRGSQSSGVSECSDGIKRLRLR